MAGKILPSERTRKVTYAIRDIVVKAQQLEQQGKKVLYLNIGDPPVYDFDTPEHIKKVLIEKIRQEHGQKVATYADSMGLKEVREAIAKFYREQRGSPAASPDDIILTAGASEGITLAIAALVNPGENLLVPLPGYPLYNSVLAMYHGEPNQYRLDEEHEWQIDLADLERNVNPKTKGIVIINPNNPTGGVYTKETIQNVIAFAGKHNLVVFADEIYDQLILDDGLPHHGVASLAGDVPVISFGGLSKNYVMPGYRVGWMLFHDPTKRMQEYIGAIKQLCRARLSSPHLQQHAVIAALEGEHKFLEENLTKLRTRRDLTVAMLNAIPGIHCVPPRGAFYAFPSVQLPEGVTDKEYVETLLEEEGVVVVYGSGFGTAEETHNGVRIGHFRIVFLPDEKVLAEAYEKIGRFTRKFYERHKYTPK
jgi:alanine-synthesizing transaminase